MEITAYMTEALLAEVAQQFEWPAAYVLEEELPDGILMEFPQCNLYFQEGYDGEVTLSFLASDTGTPTNVEMGAALRALYPVDQRPDGPFVAGLLDDVEPYGSEEKVRRQVYNLCKVAVDKLETVIAGDFSWVAKL